MMNQNSFRLDYDNILENQDIMPISI